MRQGCFAIRHHFAMCQPLYGKPQKEALSDLIDGLMGQGIFFYGKANNPASQAQSIPDVFLNSCLGISFYSCATGISFLSKQGWSVLRSTSAPRCHPAFQPPLTDVASVTVPRASITPTISPLFSRAGISLAGELSAAIEGLLNDIRC